MSTRSEIYTEIDRERVYQDRRHGHAFDNANKANDWISYIAAYAGAAYAWNRDQYSATFREKMVKVAALAVAAIEAYDRVNDVKESS